MRAAYYERTGDASDVLALGALPDPAPRDGEVLVRLLASGVNPSDVKKRQGRMPVPDAYELIVPHSDGAGVIEAVGSGVPASRIGQRVWLWNAQWRRAMGTAAEFCALPAEQAVELPNDVGFHEGACLGIPAQTAWASVMAGEPKQGRAVLVHGGAGAVGELAVAIASDAGAQVIATVSSQEKADIALAAGAAAVVDYKTEDVADAVRSLRGDVDHIVDVDFGANHAVNAKCIAVGGTIASYSAPSRPVFEMNYYAFAAKAVNLQFVQVYLLSAEDRLKAIAGVDGLLRRRALPIRIGRSFELGEIAEAHEAQEAGDVVGNIVVTIGD